MILFLKNLLFTLIVPGTVGFYLPVWVATRGGAALGGPFTPLRAVAVVLLLGGAALYFWCLWYFVKDGRATPAPIDPPKVLVVRGPYRYLRNPMYLGAWLAITGWAVWFRSTDVVVVLVTYAAIVVIFVRFYEEPTLTRLFGSQYHAYRSQVNRFLPGPPYQGPA